MRKAICLTAFLIPVSLASASAHAQSQAYFGLGAGGSDGKFRTDDFSLGLPQVAESADQTSVGWKALAGFRFHEHFAAEVSYADLGKFKYHYNDTAANGAARIDYKVSGLALSGSAIWPLADGCSLFAKAGGFRSAAKASLASASGSLATVLASAGVAPGTSSKASRTTLLYGVGAQYDSPHQVGVRLEYENYGEVGDGDNSGHVTASLISASVILRF